MEDKNEQSLQAVQHSEGIGHNHRLFIQVEHSQKPGQTK